MTRLGYLCLALVVALTAWGAMSLATKLNFGFQFTPEQLQQFNKLTDCQSHYQAPSSTTSSYFAPAEDIEVDLETDVAFLSVSDTRAVSQNRPPNFLGNIVTWSQSSNIKIAPRRMSKNFKGDEVPQLLFNPVGISLLNYQGFNANRGLWLFAVNYYHQNKLQSVAINTYTFESTMSHGFTQEYNVKNALFENLNDVAAISPTQFYVTNYQTGPGSGTPVGMLMSIFGVNTGNLVYCDAVDNACRVVLDGLSYANSVYLNHDHTQLYLTETLEKRFNVYDRDILTNELRLNESIILDGFPDNINVDVSNNVWVAATMDVVATLRAIMDETNEFRNAPSVVYRLIPKTGKADEKPSKWSHPSMTSKNFWIEIVFADNGSTITPLSVAAPTRNGDVILGSLVEPDIIRCHIPDSV